MRRAFWRTARRKGKSSEHSIETWRDRLDCRGREKLDGSDFSPDELLYRAFATSDLDEYGSLDAESIRLLDLSCNWSRFSIPHDVRCRAEAVTQDGCYGFTVNVARFENAATPVHDPICGEPFENYSHVEVRELREGEAVSSEPPRKRKSSSKSAKARRLRWRTNLINHVQRLFEPGDGVGENG